MDLGRRESIFVPFFGVPAATMTALPRIAKLAGAVVFPFVVRQLEGGRGYVAVLSGMGRLSRATTPSRMCGA